MAAVHTLTLLTDHLSAVETSVLIYFPYFFFVNLALEKTNRIVEVGGTLAEDQMLPSVF